MCTEGAQRGGSEIFEKFCQNDLFWKKIAKKGGPTNLEGVEAAKGEIFWKILKILPKKSNFLNQKRFEVQQH